MHIPDLASFRIPGVDESAKSIAVGWLEPGHEFCSGDVPLEFVNKLVELLVNPWQPWVAMGVHECGFCRLTGGPATFRLERSADISEVLMGVANLWVPAVDLLYVTPSLILHYIDAHGYAPPAEFQTGVMNCPPMRSMEYLKAVLDIRKNDPTPPLNYL